MKKDNSDLSVPYWSVSVFQREDVPKEEEESEPTETQTAPSPKKALMSFQVSEGIPGTKKMNPSVLLKSVFVPAVGFQCDVCSQSFIRASELLKHKQSHEENPESLPTHETDPIEPVKIQELRFACNMCDQSFTTNHMLKRHKLRHVRDGRKCPWCGVLFCQRHNHVVFLPQSPSEQEPDADEPEPEVKEPEANETGAKEPVVNETEKNETEVNETEAKEPETNETEPKEPETNDETHPVSTTTQLQSSPKQDSSPASAAPQHLAKIINPLPPRSQRRILRETPVPELKNVSLHSLTPQNANSDLPVTRVQSPPPEDLKLPAYLRVFSPQHLTSVFFQVHRNYDYILEKARHRKVVKKEPCERADAPQNPQPALPPFAQSEVHIKRERIAYDMEIVLWLCGHSFESVYYVWNKEIIVSYRCYSRLSFLFLWSAHQTSVFGSSVSLFCFVFLSVLIKWLLLIMLLFIKTVPHTVSGKLIECIFFFFYEKMFSIHQGAFLAQVNIVFCIPCAFFDWFEWLTPNANKHIYTVKVLIINHTEMCCVKLYLFHCFSPCCLHWH